MRLCQQCYPLQSQRNARDVLHELQTVVAVVMARRRRLPDTCSRCDIKRGYGRRISKTRPAFCDYCWPRFKAALDEQLIDDDTIDPELDHEVNP